MTERRTNLWTAVITALAALIGAAVGSTVTYLTQDRATDVRLLELGVEILQEDPQGQNEGLRQWGLSLLDRYSDEDLPDELRESLRDSISFPLTATVRDQEGNPLSRSGGWTAGGPISVDEQGTVTAEGAGRGTVIFEFGGTADTAVVQIAPSDSTGE